MSRKFTELGAELPTMLSGLFERAACNLTEEELSNFALSRECAHSMMGCLAEVCSGIGCFVGADGRESGGSNVGSFRDAASLSSLLFALSDLARQAEAMMTLDEVAQSELSRRTLRAPATTVKSKTAGAVTAKGGAA